VGFEKDPLEAGFSSRDPANGAGRGKISGAGRCLAVLKGAAKPLKSARERFTKISEQILNFNANDQSACP